LRRIIVEAEMSIDGCIGGQDSDFWQEVFKFHSDDVTEYLNGILDEPDALLMGQKTYEFFAEVWPQREGSQAEIMNSIPKYVASRTLKEPLKWNATLLEGDVVEEIKKLKQQPGKDLLQYGVGELTHTMLAAGLVDEFRLLVLPFSYGKGVRIFENMGINTMETLETRTFDSGAVALRYKPQRD
jgi:dihydrofolate reductase